MKSGGKIILGIVSIVISFFLIITFNWLALGGKVVNINDVTKVQTLALSTTARFPDGVNIFAQGYLDGSATITKSNLKENLYSYKIEKGNVYKGLSSEWYENDCILKYVPNNVTQGYLQIRYKFSDLHDFPQNTLISLSIISIIIFATLALILRLAKKVITGK
jgi:hypothetical protein